MGDSVHISKAAADMWFADIGGARVDVHRERYSSCVGGRWRSRQRYVAYHPTETDRSGAPVRVADADTLRDMRRKLTRAASRGAL